MGEKVHLSLGTDFAEVSATNPLPVTTVDAAGAGAEGAKITAATMPAGGSGKLGWLSAVWYQLTQSVATAPASTETKITAATMPAGGVGWMGWLSAIWSLFTVDSGGNLKVSLWAANGATAVGYLADNADGVAVSSNTRNITVSARSYVYNGSTYDRTRGDVNGAWVTNPSNYETVAASATAQVLGATGATGDYIQRLIIIPATTAPGVVTLLDNATSIPIWVGGTVGADLKPFTIEIGMKSASGAWKVTTGANVSAIGVGRFT